VQYVHQFFPNDCLNPVFVPLNGDVQLQMDGLYQDLAEARAPGEDAGDHHAEPPEKKSRSEPSPPAAASSALSPVPPSAIDMDGEQQPDEKKEVYGQTLASELARWFDPRDGATFMLWSAPNSQPAMQWPALEKDFLRLALLARRFLCVLPTSAPSERVWSGFGHVISQSSSTIDSSLAAKLMFLRYNKDWLLQI
jgi:hAT family C-terminal dimerisation region